jgi:3D (Asp-Asp-Asp) domain-containing protein/peptidoglycan hydrolase CwlO-like protein
VQQLVILAAIALVTALLSASTPALGGAGGQAQALHVRGTSLAQRERVALLDLYAAESQLARSHATAASLRAQQATSARERQATARRVAIVRGSLRAAEGRIGQTLRRLYMQGQPDPIAIFLGATSLDDALASIDSITRSTQQNEHLVADLRLSQATLSRIEQVLAKRSRDLAAATAAADASAARLRQAVDERAGIVSSLRRQGDVTRRALARLQQQAKAAEQRSAKLSAPPAPVTAAAAAPATATPSPAPAPPTPTPPVPTPTTPIPTTRSGTRTLVVDAVAYHLPGRTASGLPVGVGVIAVDPRVIPLGTRVFVPGYGPAVAADVGTAIIGNIIDLWMPTTAQARAWGRRTVTITIYG